MPVNRSHVSSALPHKRSQFLVILPMLATTRLMTSTTTSVPAASATPSNTIQSSVADAPKHISGNWVWISILVLLLFSPS
jgi:hypothetical protein